MLRTRLHLGLMCLLLILLSIGLYSINRCSSLGKKIEAIGLDDDTAGRNIQQLKRAGAAMTGALLSLVTEDRDRSRADFTAAADSFQLALQEENARATAGQDEKGLIAKLSDQYKNYTLKAGSFLQAQNPTEAAWRTTAHGLGKDTAQLLDLVNQLAEAHRQGLSAGNKTSAEDINSTVKSLCLLMIVAVVTAIYASMRLSHGLLDPLTALTTSIRRVGEGDLDQIVPVLSNDELGMMAVTINQMAAQLKKYRANTSVELTRLNTTVRATLASFPDPIFVLNSQGSVEFRNPEADQMAMKLLFSGVTRLPEKVNEKVEHVRATGQDYLPTLFSDAIKFHLDGQDRYFLARIVLLRDEDSEVFGVAVILEDITRMLLLDDVKSNLISTVSHELKTPLTSVRMALYLLHEQTVGPLSEKQADLVLTAREDADRLLKTLNDLLDLAKLEQGPSQLELARRAPAELVEMAIHNTREAARAASMTVTADVAADLPEVYADRQRVAYVFTNLIINALKYSSPNGEIIVRASARKNRDAKPAVKFSIIDQGPGILPEHQDHIFDRFYRVPGTNKSGAGLGLSIAREIVTAHGGEIGIISEVDKGSEFFFVLPTSADQIPNRA